MRSLAIRRPLRALSALALVVATAVFSAQSSAQSIPCTCDGLVGLFKWNLWVGDPMPFWPWSDTGTNTDITGWGGVVVHGDSDLREGPSSMTSGGEFVQFDFALSHAQARSLWEQHCIVTVKLELLDANGNVLRSETSGPLGEPIGLHQGFTKRGASINNVGHNKTFPKKGKIRATVTVNGVACPPKCMNFKFSG